MAGAAADYIDSGRAVAERALRHAGFVDVRVVPEQAEPDGNFQAWERQHVTGPR